MGDDLQSELLVRLIETARPSPAADQGALLYPCLHPEITRIISVSSAALHSNMCHN